MTNLPLDVPSLVRGGELATLGQAMAGHEAIMMEFWAVWCSPLEKALASLAEMSASNRFKGLAFAAVNVDFATAGKADEYISKVAPALPAYHEERDGLFTRLLPVKFVPSVAVVSATNGEVLYFGQLISSTLREVLTRFQNYESIKSPATEWGGRDRRAS